MKKFAVFLLLLLLLGAGGAGTYYYLFILNPPPVQETSIDFISDEEPISGLPDQYFVEVKSFTVPVLHNLQVVKSLTFHVVLSVDSELSINIVEKAMTRLVDIYIRYLVAHFEINAVGSELSRERLNRILALATHDVFVGLIELRNVLIQGVYMKERGRR